MQVGFIIIISIVIIVIIVIQLLIVIVIIIISLCLADLIGPSSMSHPIVHPLVFWRFCHNLWRGQN